MLYREYQPNELNEISELLDTVFTSGKVAPEDFRKLPCDDFTVAVAEDNGRIIGAIPMVRRAFQVAPGAVLDAWIQFRVGVSDAYRGQGIGQGIQNAATGFLKERGDIILIISTSEAARAYRFYRANGFHDVAYPRSYKIAPPQNTPAANAAVYKMNADEFYAEKAQRRAIFNECYARYGGYTLRSTRFFHANRELRRNATYWGIRENGAEAGFLVLSRAKETDQVKEIAARDQRADLLTAMLQAAREPGISLVAATTPDSPLDNALQTWGAPCPARWKNSNAMVVKPLNIPAIGQKIRRAAPGLEATEVRVWTPDREELLFAAEGRARRVLTVELKEDMLSRLLVRRIDILSAARAEWITLQGALTGDREALAEALQPAPWAFQAIDGL